jgi:uncharacterized protein (DUF2267 family)
MKHDEFIGAVQERAGGISAHDAEIAAKATLETLADRLSAGEAQDLASQLPKGLAGYLRTTDSPARSYGLDEFLDRVAGIADIRRADAKERAAAVLTTVREAVSGSEFDEVMAQLPDEFWEIVEPTSWRGGPRPTAARH